LETPAPHPPQQHRRHHDSGRPAGAVSGPRIAVRGPEIFSAPEVVVDRSPQTPIIIPPGEPIVLGYSGPLTGALSNEMPDFAIAGVLAWKELNGDEIHGHPIDLVGEDDGGVEPDIAVTAARLLIERPRLVGIVGPAFSSAAAAATTPSTRRASSPSPAPQPAPIAPSVSRNRLSSSAPPSPTPPKAPSRLRS